jgi:hypothetical protein
MKGPFVQEFFIDKVFALYSFDPHTMGYNNCFKKGYDVLDRLNFPPFFTKTSNALADLASKQQTNT